MGGCGESDSTWGRQEVKSLKRPSSWYSFPPLSPSPHVNTTDRITHYEIWYYPSLSSPSSISKNISFSRHKRDQTVLVNLQSWKGIWITIYFPILLPLSKAIHAFMVFTFYFTSKSPGLIIKYTKSWALSQRCWSNRQRVQKSAF